LEFENKGYRYYEEMLKSSDDENLTKLLKFLIEEEKRHYDLIFRIHQYLTDSYNWNMYEEGSFPQG